MTKTHILGGVVDYGTHTEGVCSDVCWCNDMNKMNKVEDLMDMSFEDLKKRESILWINWSKVKKVLEVKQMIVNESEE
tara:strand:- start:745 stop:978 length:234 start_codon:yes stop_codon:yes gene_type:complete